jgi:hypothetical protein
MGRTRDVSKILTSNTSILTLASASATYATKASSGLVLLSPQSVSTSGGTSSIGSGGTVSFTSASAISLTNVFNSNYNHYRLVLNNIIGTAGANINMRMRNSGGDILTSTYYRQYISANSTSVAGARPSVGTFWTEVGYIYNGYIEAGSIIEIMNNNLGSYTSVYSTTTRNIGTNIEWIANSFGLADTNGPFTGLTLLISSGTATGSLSVYGYNK